MTVILAIAASSAVAAPGRIDPSFGENGIARPDLGPTYANVLFGAVTALPDGGVIATRSVIPYPTKPQVRRYRPNGELDPAFPPREGSSGPEATLEGGGKLVVTEVCCKKSQLQRINADGSVDPGFAEGGQRTIPMSVRKIAPLANGKVLLAGIGIYSFGTKGPPIYQVGVARLNSDGSPDQSFHGDGLVWLRRDHGIAGTEVGALAGRSGEGVVVAVNAIGQLATFGVPERRAPNAEAALIGLTESSALDSGFGDKGIVKHSGSIVGVRVLADGKVMAAGSSRGEKVGCCYAQSDLWLGRFTVAGAPDPSFGDGGSASADLGGIDLAETVLLEESGTVLLGGASIAATPICVQLYVCAETPALARFDADGGLEQSFGEGGKVRLRSLERRAPGNSKGVLALATRPGGGTFAAGGSGPDAFLAALGPDGGLDPAFGGIVAEREAAPSISGAGAVAVDSQGRVLVAGHTDAGTTGSLPEGALVRYLPDGRLDPGFGGGRGYLEVPIEGSDLAIDGGGRTVILDRNGRWLTRVTPDGTIDSSFGEGGIVLPAAAPGFERVGFASLAALPGGGMLVAGQVVLDGSPRMAVVRLRPDGSVDRSFGRDGMATHGFGGGRPCAANKVLVQPNGRILLAGYVARHDKRPGQYRAFALMRLMPDGSLDRGFGRSGRQLGRVGRSSEATDLALQGGKVLAAGWLRRSGRFTTLLLRYRSNGHRDRGFARGGVSRAASSAAKAAIWPQATSLVPTPRRIVVVRGTSTHPVVAYRRNGRLDRSYATGVRLAPHRLTEGWTSPSPLLASQAGAPILAWTAWEPIGGGNRRPTIALQRLLAR